MSIKETVHVPVLLREVIEQMQPERGGVFVDGTFGGGGYTKALLENGADKVIAIDQDPLAIKRGQKLVDEFAGRLVLVQGRFSQMRQIVEEHNKENGVNGIILDIGFSSDQLDDFERGFSFKADGPLDMRMSGAGPSAADVIATMEEFKLADVLYLYGEERRSRHIAHKIALRRKEEKIETTQQLASLVEEVIPKWKGSGRHPAMRTFQALRIYVNQELEELENVLPEAADLLNINGRLGVVTFHSLEDRMVKTFFRQNEKKLKAQSKSILQVHERAEGSLASSYSFNDACLAQKDFKLPVRKAIGPQDDELAENTRSRSSKLRVMERTV